MLAARLPGILPPMTLDEALESAAVQSLGSQGFALSRWRTRPYRSPHHTASAVALVGGGVKSSVICDSGLISAINGRYLRSVTSLWS
ncbi:Competence protein ComM [compost metagenome]